MYSEYEFFGMNYQIKRIMEKTFEQMMERYDLRRIELDILHIVYSAGEKNTAKDIIELEHVSKAHISKSVDNLKNHGYIALVEDAADHRRVHIRVTEKGLPVVQEFERVRKEVLSRLFAGVTPEEHECLKNVMRKIMCNMECEHLK